MKYTVALQTSPCPGGVFKLLRFLLPGGFPGARTEQVQPEFPDVRHRGGEAGGTFTGSPR